jgi:hypothetical protein
MLLFSLLSLANNDFQQYLNPASSSLSPLLNTNFQLDDHCREINRLKQIMGLTVEMTYSQTKCILHSLLVFHSWAFQLYKQTASNQ